ncbi:SAM-dependent methyltransferase [Streptosporangium minutum]|uniref:SAM-dependent methyltransferase n=1 Tax=Streptosporangium minutum TaxID=569862 RepID=A0A243QGM9_9ACTN|nr:class I SAM-dependent methyltransferase [Streptosporangium minutum]OUC81151.1 SAM-dependent methyltransferase [Streptosporangium minutum]
MERQMISHIAHHDHPIAAPVSKQNLERLLTRAKLAPGARILDLGCGEAPWALRALELHPEAFADGVDISEHGLIAAQKEADHRGLSDRLGLHHVPAADFTGPEPYDLVLCVGSTHAFDGLTATMQEIRRHLRPGGLALVGEGFWETPPTPEALTKLGANLDDYGDLSATVAQTEEAGYATVYGHTSDLAEWHEYEWSWIGTLTNWALDNPGPDGDAALAAARDHRDMWLDGYRDILGFVTLLLRRTD